MSLLFNNISIAINGGLGFKEFELFNLAMLAKQAWPLLQFPDSLCARLLKSIYYPNTSVLDSNLGNHPSQIWRSLIEGRDTLKLGLIKRIGNGETTRIWEANWLPREEMMRPYGCISQNPPELVSELIDATSTQWDRQRVSEVFMPMDVRVIMAIPLCTMNIPDFWSWHYEKNGKFSIKSAYRMMVATRARREAWLESTAGSSSTSSEEGAWKKLWKTQVSGKVRMFLWRLSKHSIPTNDVRAHRHMSDSSACGLCGAQDSWRHSLIECSMSRCRWSLMDVEITENLAAITEPNAKQWLFTLMETMSHELFVRLSVTLWAIWAARRKAIHEGIFQSPHSTHGFITSFIDELDILKVKPPQVTGAGTTRRSGRPKAPPQGHAKINVDAGVRRGSRGSAAAVCRDETGAYLGN